MTKKYSFVMIITLVIVTLSVIGVAQDIASPAKGTIIAPPSTLVGMPGRVHTPLYVFIPENNTAPAIGNGENPMSIACLYGVTQYTQGCPKNGTILPTGGTKAIAVLEYGSYSNLQSDFNTFNAQFGLPTQTITVLCSPAPPCPTNNGSGWDLEEALDVQWAHAMAPNAQIIVSAFTNDPIGDGAETAAANAVAALGGGEVSNSWTYNGGENWCGSGNCELQYDSYFLVPSVVFFGSAGDSGLGPAYPSISPNVVSAGGTHITRDSNGNFSAESCWNGSGGGISHYEPLPQYQLFIGNLVGTKRGTPDWAAVADPNSGVEVYSSSYCGGWCIVGGTSVASPVLAGITNAAGSFISQTEVELNKTYTIYRYPNQYGRDFYDIRTGSNGSPARFGWDQCTGLGSPRNLVAF